MNLDRETRELVKKEKFYTAKILKNLLLIEEQKLFCDYGYPTLFKYLTKGLGYTEAEAFVRVSAVKLMKRDSKVIEKIAEGKLSLCTAADIQGTLIQVEKKGELAKDSVTKALELTEGLSARAAKEKLRIEFQPEKSRSEVLSLDERILAKIDRARKIYGENLSTYELIDILLEEKLKSPKIPERSRKAVSKNSRFIPLRVKDIVYDGQCANCGTRRNLHYDHIHEYALGGDNSESNIQLLCENCNQRKWLKKKEELESHVKFLI